MKYYIEYYCGSDIGINRKENQDNYICAGKSRTDESPVKGAFWTGFQVFGVFDGMGGEKCGREAAQIAADTAEGCSFKGDTEKKLIGFCELANDRICGFAEKHGISSMGTTAAMLCFAKNRIYICNIGDSRIYRISDGKITQLSVDHVVSYGTYKHKPPLSQNLGIPKEEMLIQPYISSDSYKTGEKYLICSDGVTDMLDEESIKQIVQENECFDAGEKLIKGALAHGGKDNITAIVLNIARERLF